MNNKYVSKLNYYIRHTATFAKGNSRFVGKLVSYFNDQMGIRIHAFLLYVFKELMIRPTEVIFKRRKETLNMFSGNNNQIDISIIKQATLNKIVATRGINTSDSFPTQHVVLSQGLKAFILALMGVTLHSQRGVDVLQTLLINALAIYWQVTGTAASQEPPKPERQGWGSWLKNKLSEPISYLKQEFHEIKLLNKLNQVKCNQKDYLTLVSSIKEGIKKGLTPENLLGELNSSNPDDIDVKKATWQILSNTLNESEQRLFLSKEFWEISETEKKEATQSVVEKSLKDFFTGVGLSTLFSLGGTIKTLLNPAKMSWLNALAASLVGVQYAAPTLRKKIAEKLVQSMYATETEENKKVIMLYLDALLCVFTELPPKVRMDAYGNPTLSSPLFNQPNDTTLVIDFEGETITLTKEPDGSVTYSGDCTFLARFEAFLSKDPGSLESFQAILSTNTCTSVPAIEGPPVIDSNPGVPVVVPDTGEAPLSGIAANLLPMATIPLLLSKSSVSVFIPILSMLPTSRAQSVVHVGFSIQGITVDGVEKSLSLLQSQTYGWGGNTCSEMLGAELNSDGSMRIEARIDEETRACLSGTQMVFPLQRDAQGDFPTVCAQIGPLDPGIISAAGEECDTLVHTNDLSGTDPFPSDFYTRQSVGHPNIIFEVAGSHNYCFQPTNGVMRITVNNDILREFPLPDFPQGNYEVRFNQWQANWNPNHPTEVSGVFWYKANSWEAFSGKKGISSVEFDIERFLRLASCSPLRIPKASTTKAPSPPSPETTTKAPSPPSPETTTPEGEITTTPSGQEETPTPTPPPTTTFVLDRRCEKKEVIVQICKPLTKTEEEGFIVACQALAQKRLDMSPKILVERVCKRLGFENPKITTTTTPTPEKVTPPSPPAAGTTTPPSGEEGTPPPPSPPAAGTPTTPSGEDQSSDKNSNAVLGALAAPVIIGAAAYYCKNKNGNDNDNAEEIDLAEGVATAPAVGPLGLSETVGETMV